MNDEFYNGKEEKYSGIKSFNLQNEEVTFYNYSRKYCICFIDIIDSTKVTMKITNPRQVRNYYSIFLNAVSATARKFNAQIIKNVGDGIICYFPNTSDPTDVNAFAEVLDCCIALCQSRRYINDYLISCGLDIIDYRISVDYGRVEIALSKTNRNSDFFGPTMNLCAKINSRAPKNWIALGAEMYGVIKSLALDDRYPVEELEGYLVADEYCYPVYTLSRKSRIINNRCTEDIFSRFLNGDRVNFLNRNEKQQIPEVLEQLYNGTIMLVDDDEDILFTFKSIPRDSGYEVEAYTDPQVAIQTFSRNSTQKYSLVITDIRMPRVNGLQFYNQIKSINTHVKFLFITALDAADELVSVIPGISHSDVLKKPVPKEAIIRKVKDHLV